ncbi:MAG: hypothetical protein QM539_06210 [Alphaproteobacteria bacterium]|nr:hypothetical protein [Alphaproteobacteria bacterium]
MKNILKLLILVLVLSPFNGKSNIHFINFEKIPNYLQLYQRIQLFVDYHDYFQSQHKNLDNGLNDDYFIYEFKSSFNEILGYDTFNIETNLLLSEVSIMLFQLKQYEYNETAKSFLEKAVTLGVDPFRKHWFLGNFHWLNQNMEYALNHYHNAQNVAQEDNVNIPVEFWQDYNKVMNQTHSWAALKSGLKNIKLLGYEYNDDEFNYTKSIDNELQKSAPESFLTNRDIWAARIIGNRNHFYSRALGIHFNIHNTSKIIFNHYENYTASIKILPQALPNNLGELKEYTIEIIPTVYNKIQTKYDFISDIETMYPNRSFYHFPQPLNDYHAFEAVQKSPKKDKEFIVYVDKTAPLYSGVTIEMPELSNLQNNLYFNPNTKIERLNNKIFYKIILKSSPDIYPLALEEFKKFIQNNWILE